MGAGLAEGASAGGREGEQKREMWSLPFPRAVRSPRTPGREMAGLGGWQRGLEAPRLGHRMTRSAQHLARAEGGGRAYKGPGGWVRAESPRGWEGRQRQRRWEPWRAREQGSSKSGGAGRQVLEWGWVETVGQRGDRTQPVRTGSRTRESWQQQEREGV